MAETLVERLKREADARASAVAKEKELADRQAELDKQDEAEARAKGPLFYKKWKEARDNMKEDLEEEKRQARQKELRLQKEKARMIREEAYRKKQEENARKAKWIEAHTKRYPRGGVYFGDLDKSGHPHGDVGDWQRPSGDAMYEGSWHNGQMYVDYYYSFLTPLLSNMAFSSLYK